MKQKKIGISSKGYSTKRFITNKLNSYQYVDIRFLNKHFWFNLHLIILRQLKLLKLFKFTDEDVLIRLFLKYKIIFPFIYKFDIFHFFNTVNFSKRIPWVLTIESCLPYNRIIINCLESKNPDFSIIKNDNYAKQVLHNLFLDSCKGLLAVSECTRQIQLEVLKHFPEYKEEIEKKLITLHPPQDLLIKNIDDKGIGYGDDDLLRFVFIGRDFFRKGGKQVLDALKHFNHQYKIELILITDLDPGKDKFAFFTDSDLEQATEYILENEDWIKYYPSIPNNEVLEIMKKSHIALLPTWMDTYGYSVLECQASGCPVITTNLRSLTEINYDEVGWVIPVPVNRLKHPIYLEIDDFKLFEATILNELIKILQTVFINRQIIREKAAKGLERIVLNHDPFEYAEKLNKIYDGSLIN